jgi:ABC-type sugar transport system permease subunit
LNVAQGFERWIGAAHCPDLNSRMERYERAADEGILGLDQIAGVQVEWTEELLGRLDSGCQQALATNRIEDGIKRVQPVTPRDEQRVGRGGKHGEVGVQGTHVRLEVARRGLFAFMCLLVLVVDLPVVTLVLNSFRSTNEILSSSSIIPAAPSLVNFEYVAQRTSFFRYLLNSLIMAGGGMALSIAVATLAGYALSRFRSRAISTYANGLFLVQMFPILLALIPLFIFFRTLGSVNTYWSVIILYTVAQLPFATSMFRAFFDGIPHDLEEAAKIDGANRLQALAWWCCRWPGRPSPQWQSSRFCSHITSTWSPPSCSARRSSTPSRSASSSSCSSTPPTGEA